MRMSVVGLGLGLVLQAACAPAPSGVSGMPAQAGVDSFTRITQEAEFRRRVVGRRLADSSGAVTFNPDGTFDGFFTVGRFAGDWYWQDGYFCRSGKLGGRDVRLECELVEIDDKKLRLIRAKGLGQVIPFTID